MLRASLRGLNVPGWRVRKSLEEWYFCDFRSRQGANGNIIRARSFRFQVVETSTYQPLNLWCTVARDRMAKKSKPEIKLGATVRLCVHSGEIVEGRVVHMWEDKSVPMVRVASGDLVYNVPAKMLIDERGSK